MTLPNPNNQMISTKTTRQPSWFFFVLAVLFVGLYLFNISGWLIHDDEGTDLYEAWQLQMGEQPGVDFIAEQQPLYLLLGKIGLGLSEDSRKAVMVVRIFSAVQVLVGSIFLGLVVKRKWGEQTGALVLGLILTSGLLYEQARLFRPDPMMFAWELFGLGFVLLAVDTGKRPYWAAAGIAYGIAVLMKLFGIFPVIGLVLFYLYLFIKQSDQWRKHLLDGLSFAIPFLLFTGGASLILYGQMGFYYQEAFNQHLSLGQQRTIWEQIYITAATYFVFFLVNITIPVFIVPLAIMNQRSGESVIHFPEKTLLYTQLLVPFFFVFITRPIFPRYIIFVLPAVALLLALHLKGFFNKFDVSHQRLTSAMNLVVLLVIGFSLFTTYPSISNRLTRREEDTIALAQTIQALTQPNDIVVSDYASLNFHAKRQSIYEASIVAGGRISGGIVTGALLIERIKATEAKLVLIHREGGDPAPHQLVELIDLELFEAYLHEKYQLVEVFDRADQIIEIYERK